MNNKAMNTVSTSITSFHSVLRVRPFSVPVKHKQNGAVLIVALIMLVIMSIIGLDSMQSTLLEEKMSHHVKDKNYAFQSAEAALLAGENEIATTTPSVGNHVYSAATDMATQVTTASTWTGTNSQLVTGTTNQRYVIQVPAVSGEPYHVYARAEGYTSNSIIMLKSLYNK